MAGRATRASALLATAQPHPQATGKGKKKTRRSELLLEVPRVVPGNPSTLVERGPNCDPVAVSKTCWMLHPDYAGFPNMLITVAYEKTDVNWKTKGQKAAAQCGPGEQLVQVHGTLRSLVPMMFPGAAGQHLQTLDNVVTTATTSTAYISGALAT
jgi:hypothetical protein